MVGFDLLATGRRRRALLSDQTHDAAQGDIHWRTEETEVVEHMLYNASWQNAGDLCRSLVYAYRVDPQSLGVVDRHFLKECLHTRLIINTTVRAYNLTNATADLGDTFMLTWHGVGQVRLAP